MLGRVIGGEHLQLVHALEVEAECTLLAVDLDAIRVLHAGGQTGRLEAGHRAPGEPGEEEHRVVDGAAAGPARVVDEGALLDEGLDDGAGDLDDLLSGDEPGHVDDVSAEVTECPGSGHSPSEAPEQRRLGPAPPLQVSGADVVHPPHPAGLHELMSQRHGRDPPVAVPDKRVTTGPAGGVAHGPSIVEGAGQRLLAGHVLAGLQRRHGLVGVDIVGGGHVDKVDLGVVDGGAPSGGAALPPPPIRELPRRRGVSARHHRQARLCGEIEEPTGGAPGVGVGPAHELCSEQGHVQLSVGGHQRSS